MMWKNIQWFVDKFLVFWAIKVVELKELIRKKLKKTKSPPSNDAISKTNNWIKSTNEPVDIDQ